MQTTSVEEAPDSDLIVLARTGDLHAFALLWERHQDAALRLAKRLVPPTDAEDVTSEAFANTLQALQNGGGPDGLFRPYIYVAIRNIAMRWSRRDSEQRATVDIDFELIVDPSTLDDPTVESLDRSVVSVAFRSLPQRWQEVLWYTEVEGMSASEVAPILGMTSNSVAALSYRARDGFRRQWLEKHLLDTSLPEVCAEAAREFERSADISPRLAAHMSVCARCSTLAATAEDAPARLRMVLAPLLLGGTTGGILIELLTRNASEASAVVAVSSSAATASSVLAVAHVPTAVTAVIAVATVITIAAATITGPPANSVSSSPTQSEQSQESPSDVVDTSTDGHGTGTPAPLTTATPTPTTTPAPPTDAATGAQPRTPSAPPPPSQPPAPTADVTPPTSPQVLTTIDPAATAGVPLSGTGEPGSTVSVSDSSGVLATVLTDSQGNWVTPTLALQPHTTALVITQTDAAGNVSPAATINPGFRPTLGLAPNWAPFASVIDVYAYGWPGATYLVTVDGQPGPVSTVGPNGVIPVYVGFVSPGPHDVVYGYVDPVTHEYTAPMHYYFEGGQP